MADRKVPTHEITRTIVERYIDPSHARRETSPEFRTTVRRLKRDGHYRCYVCGSTKALQVHHRAAEWMFAGDVDFARLKEFCEEWDCYGYGRLLREQPITSVDDVRNAMVLCRQHHIGRGTGIHELTFPTWVIQRIAARGKDPVPQGDADG